MSPEAEKSITQEGFPSIKPSEISPSSLALFLNKQDPSLMLGEGPKDEIFNKLRTLPTPKQEELLVSFYSKQVEGFPNPEKLGKFLTMVNNISWFRPVKEPEISDLEKYSREWLSRLNYTPMPVKIIKDDWYAALDAAQDATLDAAQDATLYTVWRAALDYAPLDNAASEAARWEASDAAWGATRTALALDYVAQWAALDAALGAIFTTLEDLMAQKGFPKNPFEPLMEIYQLGCWPIGPAVNPEGNREFVIFVPQIRKPA